jgi:hypothetical protein
MKKPEAQLFVGVDWGFGESKIIYNCSACGVSEMPCKHYGTEAQPSPSAEPTAPQPSTSTKESIWVTSGSSSAAGAGQFFTATPAPVPTVNETREPAPQPTPPTGNIWSCVNCRKRIQTCCGFAINFRPLCVECNAEMEPYIPNVTPLAAEAPAQPSPATCSCSTAHEAHTFGGRPMQYCPGVKCPWCGSAAKFDWKKSNEHLCRNIGHFAGEFEAAASPSVPQNVLKHVEGVYIDPDDASPSPEAQPSPAPERFSERLSVPADSSAVQLSHYPLVAIEGLQGRYGIPRRGEWPFPEMSLEFALVFALVFALPGTWTVIDPATVDVELATGKITFPVNALGLFFNEIDITYTAEAAASPILSKEPAAETKEE